MAREGPERGGYRTCLGAFRGVNCIQLMGNTIQWADLPVDFPPYNEEEDTLVRQSLIGDMQLCEYRVKLKTHKGYLETVIEPAFFGTCIHYLIAGDLEVGDVRLDLLSNMDEWVQMLLDEQYIWKVEDIPNRRDFYTEITAAYRMWRGEVYPKLSTAVALEKEMWLPLGEGERGNYHLRGTPDAVFENEIVDWKSSGKAWKEGKAEFSIQVSPYMALAKQNLDLDIKKFRFWIFDRQKRQWTTKTTSRRVRDINAALLSIRDYAYKMEVGAYTATPVAEEYGKKKRGWYCSTRWCGAWNVCPAKYLNDSINERDVAVTSWK